MSWVYFVILATFAWSITNVMDKFLVEKKVGRPLMLAILIRSLSLIPLLLILPFVGFSFPSIEFTGWIMLAGVFAAGGVIIFYKAIKIGEVSRTIPLFQFIPVFVLFLSFFLIGEVLGFSDYVGFVILVLGGLVISAKNISKVFRVEKVFWLVVVSSFLHAISYVIMKHVLSNIEYWNAFIVFWAFQGMIILSLLGLPSIRKQAKFYMKALALRDKTVILLDSAISILAFIFNYFAISLGPVTLVEAAGNIQLVFIFLLALFLTKFFPNVLEERFDRGAVMQKATGTALIIMGVLLTQLF